MECTQRLECTQELYSNQRDKLFPEQIGFLGICGTKYPLKKGPNKIGRDPQTCTVILKLDSISRQHALINILNQKSFMLMDLDSVNQTKLLGKTLQPYIPHPLHNGDTVQFGDIFGVFRLLEDEDDLPMTQALNIPDTPVPVKHVSSVNVVTTIPESPDVSDKDDSFIVLSHPKGQRCHTPKTPKFIKPGKTIAIQPVGTNKIDNIYWSSSKKSTSLNLDDSNGCLDDSIQADVINVRQEAANNIIKQETPDLIGVQKLKKDNTGSKHTATAQGLENAAPPIFEADAEIPAVCSPNTEMPGAFGPPTIYTAETQILADDNLPAAPSIYEADTEIPAVCSPNTELPEAFGPPTIYTAETQILTGDNSPAAPSIYEADTEIPAGISPNTEMPGAFGPPTIYTAETQILADDNLPVAPSICKADTEIPAGSSPSIHSLDTQIPGAFGPPTIYTAETQIPAIDNLPEVYKINEQQDMQFDIYAKKCNNSIYNAEKQMFSPEKNNVDVSSPKIKDSPSSDKLNSSNEEVVFDEIDDQLFEGFESQPILSDDIILPVNRFVEPDIDSQAQIIKPKCSKRTMRIQSDSSTDCDDIDMLPTQIIPEEKNDDDDTTDCDEGIIEIKAYKTKTTKPKTSESPKVFEELDTQVIELDVAAPKSNKDVDLEDMPTQVIDIDAIENDALTEKGNSPIKKQSNTDKLFNEGKNSRFKVPFPSPLKQKRTPSKILKVRPVSNINKAKPSNTDDEKYYNNTQGLLEDLCTQEELPNMPVNSLSNNNSVDKVSLKSQHKKKETSNTVALDTSVDVVDAEKRVNDFVSNMSSQEIRDVIGVDIQVTKIAKVPSDGSTASDVEVTPKKLRPLKFMNMDLPNSQEIKTSVSISARCPFPESSSESDTENNSEEQCTPILFHRKKKPKTEAKIDLTKKFDVDALPSRVITRVRKPTRTVQDLESKTTSVNILKPTFLTDQDGDIDNDIITENIMRLKTKNKKSKTTKSSNVTSENIKVTVVEEERQTKDIAKTDKKERDSRNKPEKHQKNKFDKNLTKKAKDSKKDVKIKKPEPKNREFIDANESSVTSKSTKPSLVSKFESKDKTHISSDSMEIETLDHTISPVQIKRTTRTARTVKAKDIPTKTKEKSTTLEQESLIEKPNKRKYTKKPKVENERISEEEITPEPANITGKPNTRKHARKQVLEDKKLLEKKKYPESQTDKPNKRKHTRKRDPNIENNAVVDKEQTPEKVVWKSTRQRKVKDKVDENAKVIKSILKKSVPPIEEESVVYNVSGSNSPHSLKRPALDDSDVPSAKKIRSVVVNNTSLRATPARIEKTHYILFTAFPYRNVKVKLEKMGVVTVTDVMQCTVLLTQNIKRTFKLLCAVGLGKPIVGPNWVQACADANMIVDPWHYLIKDEETEKRFNFSLQQSLAGKRNFLEGYNVSSTPSVIPNAQEMRLIVECSGGTWKEGGPNWVCVSVAEDLALWPRLRERGATVVTAEFILTGVLRQKVEIGCNKYM